MTQQPPLGKQKDPPGTPRTPPGASHTPPGSPHTPVGTEAPGTGPIAAATALLWDWLSRTGVAGRLAPPGADSAAAGPGLCLWPLAVLPEQATRRAEGRDPLRLRVRYLVHAGGADPTAAAATGEFDRLLAGLPDRCVQLILEPVSTDTWRGFGVAPQLGLYLDVITQVAQQSPTPPRVRAPMRLASRPLTRVHGTVVGPGGVPVPGMKVVEQQTGASAYTGNRGQFAFPAVPAGGPIRLRLSGRGQHLAAEVAEPGDEPIIIHCDMEGE